MILGKTNKQRYDKDQEALRELKDGYLWFAWRPVKENFGRIVWLQTVRVDIGIYEHKGELCLPKPKCKIYHLLDT